MTLTNTNKYAISSFVFFVLGVGVAVVVYFVITNQGQKLEEEMKVIGTNKLVEKQLVELSEVLDQTEEDRDVLTGYLLTEGKTIKFLNEVETLARDRGLKFTTDTLEVNELSNPQFDEVELHFSAIGNKNTLIKFLDTIETLPYFSHISSLTFAAKDNSRADSSWG